MIFIDVLPEDLQSLWNQKSHMSEPGSCRDEKASQLTSRVKGVVDLTLQRILPLGNFFKVIMLVKS